MVRTGSSQVATATKATTASHGPAPNRRTTYPSRTSVSAVQAALSTGSGSSDSGANSSAANGG